MTAANQTFGAYSLIRRGGDLYFTSGHVGVDPITNRVDSDITTQTLKTINNLAKTLATVDLSLDNIIKTTVFLTDMDDFTEMNEAYKSCFTSPYPARSTVAVKELPRVASNGRVIVEIEAIACKKEETN